MKVLVTGASGFLVSHTAHYFSGLGADVVGTFIDHETAPFGCPEWNGGMTKTRDDVRDAGAVTKLVEADKPNLLFHYSGQAYCSGPH